MEASSDSAAGPRRPRRPGRLRGWLRAGFVVAVLAFGVVFVSSQWGEFDAALRTMSWGLVALSMLPAAGGTLAGMLGWRAVMTDLSGSLSVSQASRVFLIGQLGKYLPGSVWSFLAQAELARDYAVSRKATLTASVLAVAISLASGATVAAVTLPFGAGAALSAYWWVLLVLPLSVVLLHPRVVGPLVDLGLRLLRRRPLDQYPTYRGQLTAAGWYAVGWLLLGLHAWLLVVALGAPAAPALPISVGGFALAVVAGVLFVPAPAGAGVREVVIVLALGSLLTSSQALAVALTSRVILTGLDFALAGVSWLVGRGDRAEGPRIADPPPVPPTVSPPGPREREREH